VDSTFSTYTNIYVVFPPQLGTNNNMNFVNSVMTNNAIDGVTLQVPWSQVELNASPPTTTPCAQPGTDLCQQDGTATSYYHTYNWNAIDGTGCADTGTYSSSPWFCLLFMETAYKTVNFVLAGIGDPPTNPFTPTYVTSSWWISAVGASHQDVVNSINASGCNIVYSGSITSIPGTAVFTGNGANLVNVTGWSSPPVVAGDTIWVSGLTAGAVALNVTGQYGAVVSTSGCGMGASFCYPGGGSSVTGGGPPSSVVKAVDSWPVPYEAPYAAGWLAFLKAAIYHFNHMNITTPGYGQQNLGHIRYIRPGVAKGGEAQPICTTALPMTNASPNYNQTQWISWYTKVVQTVQQANPLMQIMLSINSGSTPTSAIPIADFATAEAGVAVSYSNSTGLYNGFGSQGLRSSDITSGSSGFQPANCPDTGNTPDTANNWGCMFTNYWSGSVNTGSMTAVRTTVPLELQQIDCSNPTGSYDPSDGCFIGNTGGDTGNLANDYAFATANHASILELYAQDALLAYDPNFCKVVTGTCTSSTSTCSNTSGYDWFGTDLSACTQYNFFVNAGQGTMSCSGQPTQCPYAKAITAAHGQQP